MTLLLSWSQPPTNSGCGDLDDRVCIAVPLCARAARFVRYVRWFCQSRGEGDVG
jgi:hypothetical protein